ncbi:MAG: 50S ribosomal protein L15 [bacterium]|nr:50S ribosomal protein L15 [bacterium]
MKLNELKPAPGATHKRKRLGRGPGSGLGKTAGRGHKGQHSRSGSKHRAWFEGGQMPIQRRVPKRGFTNIFRVEFQVVNVGNLARIPEGVEVTPESLYEHGLIRKRNVAVKLLGDGTVDRAYTVRVDKCSIKARELVENAGGKVEVSQ